ncbi:MAG: EscU/YscU/HrcU family type III secretion system export apparatus switch protein [Pseudomonadota bacterium]
MDQQEEQDKTEQATPYKLRQAKRQGQVAKSTELTSAVVLVAALLFASVYAEELVIGFLRFVSALFSNAHVIVFEPENIVALLSTILSGLLHVVGPLIGVILIAALVGNFIQTGPILSTQPIKPDFKRISPVTGLKRIFSIRLLYEAVKTIIKVALYAVVIWMVIRHVLPQIVALIDTSAKYYGAFLISVASKLLFALVIAIFVVAVIDVAYTRWEFLKRMRMSRRELKEEIKRREGDPRVRSKLKELQHEAAKRAGSINRVPDADVIITNPQRLAVAIRYNADEHNVPIVLAKGGGLMAKMIRMTAAKHNIPLIENKAVARHLFRRTAIGDPIDSAMFAEVARILVWVFATRERSRPSFPVGENAST